MHRKTIFTTKLEKWLLREFLFNLWVLLTDQNMVQWWPEECIPQCLLTCCYLRVCREHHERSHDHRLISLVDSLLCFAVVGSGRQILSGICILCPSLSPPTIIITVIIIIINILSIYMSLLLVYNLTHAKVGHCSFMTLILLNTGACTLIHNYFLIYAITKVDSIIMTFVYEQLFYYVIHLIMTLLLTHFNLIPHKLILVDPL